MFTLLLTSLVPFRTVVFRHDRALGRTEAASGSRKRTEDAGGTRTVRRDSGLPPSVVTPSVTLNLLGLRCL